MWTKLKLIRKGERGAQLVEMALVMGLLLLLLAGIADLGRAFHYYIVITNAAREGARAGSRFPHLADAMRDAAVQEASLSGVSLNADKITISPYPPPGSEPWDAGVAQPGEPIEVTVSYDYLSLIGGVPYFDIFFDIGTLTLSNSATMRVFGSDQF